MKKIIAITGGIGSGKSEVLRIIKGLGYFVISADDVNRELLVDEEYLKLLQENFVEAFPNGAFDKKILANIIFNDNERRLLLNSIAHKRISKLIDTKINSANDDIVYVEVPLLVESGMIDMFTDVIVVTADVKAKLKRVAKRDNISVDDVNKRMRSQLSDNELKKVATYIIENNDTLDALIENTNKVVNSIKNK